MLPPLEKKEKVTLKLQYSLWKSFIVEGTKIRENGIKTIRQ